MGARKRSFVRSLAVRFTEEGHSKLLALVRAWGVSISDVVRIAVTSHQGLTELRYGPFGVSPNTSKLGTWNVTCDGREMLATGVSLEEAVEKAQFLANMQPAPSKR